ncbi:hypothetical protein AAFC00_000235 [Neodothiora populina]|uniref:Uncharacterized protein n=1 Tax=Neodothiora populina TaxID=2781224 RepID=A0ABR3P271_9PEZI
MEPQESVFVVAQSSPLRESQQQAFPMSPSRSAPDMNRCVADLVGRFNTLEVKDVDEEKTARQMKRLEAALRRAEIAREEAESEVKHLRKEVRELNEVGEDWVAEKKNFKGRVEEYEKKYEKAKAHFRAQRSKHDEATRKAAKEFMEREKQHWRAQSAVEEEIEWERKLRVDAYDLIAFMEVERQMMMRTAREERKRMASPARADSAVGERIGEDGKIGREERVRTKPDLKVRAEYPARVVDEVMCDSPREIEDRTSTTGQTQQHDHDATHQATSEHPAIPLIHEDAANSAIHDEVTPEPESEAPISQPKKHTLTVPIKFGDEEEEEEGPSDDKDNEDDLHNSDKENSAPLLHHSQRLYVVRHQRWRHVAARPRRRSQPLLYQLRPQTRNARHLCIIARTRNTTPTNNSQADPRPASGAEKKQHARKNGISLVFWRLQISIALPHWPQFAIEGEERRAS